VPTPQQVTGRHSCTANGLFPLATAQHERAIPWVVQLWPVQPRLFASDAFTPGNYAAVRALIDVDAPVRTRRILTADFPAAGYWLPIGPRGVRFTVHAQSINVALQVAADGAATTIGTPPLEIQARVSPGPSAAPEAIPCYVPGISTVSLFADYQLPLFSREYRLITANPLGEHAWLDGRLVGAALTVLTDPLTGKIYDRLDNASAWNWKPIHPLAAGIRVPLFGTAEGGVALEVR